MSEIVNFADAQIGESAYTWELPEGDDWGEYRFETVDPLETHTASDWAYDPPTMVRKRWTLTEVTKVSFPDVRGGDDE